MESPSKEARRTALELAENNFTLEGNLRGIETPVAAETRVRGWRREEAAVVTANKQAYTQYKAEGAIWVIRLSVNRLARRYATATCTLMRKCRKRRRHCARSSIA